MGWVGGGDCASRASGWSITSALCPPGEKRSSPCSSGKASLCGLVCFGPMHALQMIRAMARIVATPPAMMT